MLVGESNRDPLEVAIVAEHSSREREAAELVAKCRAEGFKAELFATGSPRKRFDKARKAEPAVLVSFDVRDGQDTTKFACFDDASKRVEDAKAFLSRYQEASEF